VWHFSDGTKLGVGTLWALSFNNDSFNEYKEKYKGSSTPYFIGFGLLIGVVYLILKLEKYL